MLAVPKEKPVLTNLNTYYLKLDKLIEHCQGEMDAGGILFKSPAVQGVVYFDSDNILNAYCSEKNTDLRGPAAVAQLLQANGTYNFSLDIYRIPFENIYFWSNTPTAERIFKDLSTEFTDLEGLMKKMRAEKLTGYIDILIGNGQESGMIFFGGGEIVGGSFSWGPVQSDSVKAASRQLVEKTIKIGGIFQVCRISMDPVPPSPAGLASAPGRRHHVLRMLEEFLGIFETLYITQKDKTADFNSLIRKKFVENAERFTFLDPFAGEFDFNNRQIRFSGAADDAELANGIIVSTTELATEIGVGAELKKYLVSWQRKYEEKLDQLGIRMA